MKTQFRTLKSVKSLVYAKLSLRALMHRTGVRFPGSVALPFFHTENQIRAVVRELEDWSRAHRKLNDGRPAVVQDFLLLHAGEIRSALDALSALVDDLDTKPLSDAGRAIVAVYKANLDAAWALDLEEPEAHELARLAPAPTEADYGEYGHMTPAQLQRAEAVLRSVLAEKLAPAPEPAPTDDPSPAQPLLPGDGAALVADLDAWLGGDGAL